MNELVRAGCPQKALASYRKILITGSKPLGRKKRLTARQADSAIAGALACITTGPLMSWDHSKCRKGTSKDPDKCGRRRNDPLCKLVIAKKRAVVPESPELLIRHGYWYASQGMPVIFARHADHQMTDDEDRLMGLAIERGCEVVWLRWSDDGVYRLGEDVLPYF